MRHILRNLLPGILAVAALALATNASAQAPAPSTPAAKPAPAPPMAGHHMTDTAHDADMKAQCQAMEAKKQEMQDKLLAMDATLDKLVAEMNAAKSSKEADAMEKPMAAVINELVLQRKTQRSMMMDMQPPMMEHMMHHMAMHGSNGPMECPMMKMDKTPEPKPAEKKP